MAKRPHQDTQLARFIERRVLELRPVKSQIQIASEAGFANPNMISMIKSGASKLALDRVPSMARALECDTAFLMRLALEQAIGPTAAVAVTDAFGQPITSNELAWVEAIREASNSSDPRLTSRARTALLAIFGK